MVLQYGTSLAQRREANNEGINLYRCADENLGFFVEVGMSYGQH